jgi:hypothetical protein
VKKERIKQNETKTLSFIGWIIIFVDRMRNNRS